jgi:hypothetical protein
MEKILKALASKTVWAGVILFLVSGFEGVQNLVPDGLVFPIQAVLTFLVAYFKVNPSQRY